MIATMPVQYIFSGQAFQRRSSMPFDPLKPWRLGPHPLWHWPIPQERQMTGDHPSSIHGFGEDIVEIREMEPGESPEWYSPIESARTKKRMAVYHTRTEEVGVQLYLDVGPAIDFGTPSKRLVAIKIMASFAGCLYQEPNQGTATIIGVGGRTIFMPDLGDQVVLVSCLHRLGYSCGAYTESDTVLLSRALKQYSSIVPEQLVCIFSDFLIPPRNDEAWKGLEKACRRVVQQGGEVVCIRVLSPLEVGFPTTSVTVSSRHGKNSDWTGLATHRTLIETQHMIRERLLSLCLKPSIRFLEIVWNDHEEQTVVQIQEFLRARTRYLRSYMDTSST